MGRGVERAEAKQKFDAARKARDAAKAAGDEVGAWEAHEKSSQIVRDFNKGRRG